MDIKNKAECCGCTACAGICPENCIQMKVDAEGFRYPKTDVDNCVNCGACLRICPILNPVAEMPSSQEGYIVQNRNPEVLKESTSGGAFTAIAKYVLSKHGVVFGVELSSELEARHIYVESESDLFRLRNSKYIESSLTSGGGI